jgi:hypothetical protein
VRLTRKNLALLEKIANESTKKSSVSAPPGSTDESSSAKTLATTTSGFAVQAYSNGILASAHSRSLRNLEGIRKRHTRSCETPSPTQSVYEGDVNNVEKAATESTIAAGMSRHMVKKYGDKGYNQVFNQAFTGFPKDVGFNNGLSVPQPGFIEGLEIREYHPFPVDKCVKGSVLYKDNPFSLTLPHLAGEWKGPGKDMKEAELQYVAMTELPLSTPGTRPLPISGNLTL